MAKDVADKIRALEEINSFIDTVVEEFEEVVSDQSPFLPDGDPESCKSGGTPGPELPEVIDVSDDCCDDGECEC